MSRFLSPIQSISGKRLKEEFVRKQLKIEMLQSSISFCDGQNQLRLTNKNIIIFTPSVILSLTF